MKIIIGTLLLLYGTTVPPIDPTATVLGLAFWVWALRAARA